MKTQSSAKKNSEKTYRTYLLRCWSFSTEEKGQRPTRRFVLETVSNPPRRWVFDSLAALNDFLQTETVEQQ
jgi:hypothetical protein